MDQGKVSTEPAYCHPHHTGPNGTARRHRWNGEQREHSSEGGKLLWLAKAEQYNWEGKWEALTSFDKNKQIWTEGKVQGGAPMNLNSKTLQSTMPTSNNRGWTKRANFHEELARSSEANKDHKGEEGRQEGKDEEELWTSRGRALDSTWRPVIWEEWNAIVARSRYTRGSSTIDQIKTKQNSPISTPSSVGQVEEEIKRTLTCKTERPEKRGHVRRSSKIIPRNGPHEPQIKDDRRG